LAGCYRVNGASGQICTNGEPRNLKQFRKLSRYIMQEDLLQPFITVQEAMVIAADLKLGTAITKQKKAVVVGNILLSKYT
jgi:ABC-type multidrug transport system ATPase subunit